MKHASLIGAAMVCIAVLCIGFALYQQEERHFSESQRWLEVCKRQLDARLKRHAERMADDSSLPEQVRKDAQLGIEAYDEDYLYSSCYKEFHGGQ